jgi:sterol 3beta-glucosyltransferase
MRLSIHTLGTRGDFQPYLALAAGLEAAGHDVQLVAPAQFAQLVHQRRVDFEPLSREFLAMLDDPEVQAFMGGRASINVALRLFKRMRPVMLEIFEQQWRAASRYRPDLLIWHPKAIAVPHLAERLKIGSMLASPLPVCTPTSAFPTPLLPFASLGPLNQLSHSLVLHGATALYGETLRRWREQTLQLPARGKPPDPLGTLYGYSSAVLPKPPDWGAAVHVTGYWFLEDDEPWQTDPELARFLQTDPTPIYIGFGSMPTAQSAQLAGTVREAVIAAGVRAVVATGGGGALSAMQASEQILCIDSAPHHLLFPLLAAVVHHGGAGTTAAALKAGKPNFICPFLGDQPFWGRRVADLGIGPEPIAIRRLTTERLAHALREITTRQDLLTRAHQLAQALERENGVKTAVEIIEQRLRA